MTLEYEAVKTTEVDALTERMRPRVFREVLFFETWSIHKQSAMAMFP